MSENGKTKKLLNMKSQIDKGKLDKARLEGEQESLFKRLKEDFGCKDLKAAELKLSQMDKDIDAKESQLKKGIERLETQYDW